ncbi:urease subunit beta [Mitsuokella sp.]|uniref:urease subunit beta n=1 Tax=Mitsuokella sp. TaxID=2049034 RepID=UPI003F737E23
MIPGEMLLQKGDITLNEGRESLKLVVTNVGDRPVQVGAHYHFFEVNRCLKFDRAKAFGMRLDIPSGTSVRFEPGEQKTVELVELRGRRRCLGFNALTMGPAGELDKEAALRRARERGFLMETNDKEAAK